MGNGFFVSVKSVKSVVKSSRKKARILLWKAGAIGMGSKRGFEQERTERTEKFLVVHLSVSSVSSCSN
jgi:hypothetical protein